MKAAVRSHLLKLLLCVVGLAPWSVHADGWAVGATYEPQWGPTCMQSGGTQECIKGLGRNFGWAPAAGDAFRATNTDWSNFINSQLITGGFTVCSVAYQSTETYAPQGPSLGLWQGQQGLQKYKVIGDWNPANGTRCDVEYSWGKPMPDGFSYWAIEWGRVSYCPAGYTTPSSGPSYDYCTRQPVDCCLKVGNPIDLLAKAKEQQESDFASPAHGLEVVRSYNSSGLALLVGADASATTRVLGPYWRHNYQRQLVLDASNAVVGIYGAYGTTVRFRKVGGIWTALGYQRGKLFENKAGQTTIGWRYRPPDGSFEDYDAAGNLLSLSSIDGKQITFAYTDGTLGPNGAAALDDAATPVPAGLLRRALDQFGRSLVYDYSAQGMLLRISLPDGTFVKYTYLNSNPRTVEYADASTRTYLYTADDNFAVGNPSLLMGIVDELGVRVSYYKYDPFSFTPTSTSGPGTIGAYSVSYPNGVPAVVDPTHAARSWTTTVANGIARVASETRACSTPECTGTVSQTSAYDATGSMSERRDFNGVGTCFVNDPIRKVEMVRVEGVPKTSTCATYTPDGAALAAGVRKITMSWHPDLDIEVKRAEPGKVTSSIYNGQPDPFNGGAVASCAPTDALLPDGKPIVVLCRKVEVATADADGRQGMAAPAQAGVAPRQTTMTYNRQGQLLTVKGPRTDVNDTTTYAYFADTTVDHTTGDLSQVTNAVGQATRYLQYDRGGRLLQANDANSVTTVNEYDLRGRLLRSTVGGLRTTNTYDLTGQLKSITAPSGAARVMAYDAAHRLTAVTDAAGNTTTYTLDDAGNRIQEQTTDAGGNVLRTIVRRFDAFGRVQVVTGASQ